MQTRLVVCCIKSCVALTDAYIQTPAQLSELFRQIRQGQAPGQFTIQHLKDLGFRSTNHRAFIPLLKAIGFLTADGKPTERYHEYRNESISRQILGQAIREAYSDLFVLRSKPADADRALFEGKFKSAHNVSDRVSKLMASTFYGLLGLADIESARPGVTISAPPQGKKPESEKPSDSGSEQKDEETAVSRVDDRRARTSLHYNIQIHLPATKDIEVFNAIFKSLKEHLLE